MPRTLVIDDDPVFEAQLSGIATDGDAHGSEGMERSFVFARTDEEALHIMRTDSDLDIAVVNIDGVMGGMDLFRRLDGRRLRIPRIALTTRAVSAPKVSPKKCSTRWVRLPRAQNNRMILPAWS